MLSFPDGEPFSIGSQLYIFRPATVSDSSKRIIIEVEIQGRKTSAMLDTGAPYLVCNPEMAELLGLDPAAAIDPASLGIRNQLIQGSLHRLDLTFCAENGEDLTIDATAFVPQATEVKWPGLPAVIGFEGCLDRIRFAIDASDDTFYFGPHA